MSLRNAFLRMNKVRTIVAAGLFLILVLPSSAQARPNVLFIVVDDLNSWVGYLKGHPNAYTPSIDKLAKRGTAFMQAYASAPLCNPSRASLLSGLRPSTTGIYTNSQPWYPTLQSVTTLPQQFRNNGYYVAAGGKIFDNLRMTDPYWTEYFDEFTDLSGGSPPPTDANGNLISLTGLYPPGNQFDWGPTGSTTQASDYKLAVWASNWLAAPKGKPFMLMVGFVKPHMPWYVPQKYFNRHSLSGIILPTTTASDLDDIPPQGLKFADNGDHEKVLAASGTKGSWDHGVQAYSAAVTFVDEQIGRVIAALDASGLASNTIIVLWGDHGFHLGGKEHWRKSALWEETLHAPLIFVVSGVTTAGTKCYKAVDFMNIFPTLEELAGLPVRSQNEGFSMVRLLRDPKSTWTHPAVSTYKYKNHTVRTNTKRYIRYYDDTEELYDHTADPHEFNNLAPDPSTLPTRQNLAGYLPTKNAQPVPWQ
jgi:iduronate 2-sulfatase